MNYFITGTNTETGKTYFTRLLVESLRKAGVDAVGYKPISCGGHNDARLLASASGPLPQGEVNTFHFKTPTAPYVAGLLENKTVDPTKILEDYQKLAARHSTVIIEGIGGWEVPIAPSYNVSDLAKDLGLPVLLIAENKLGALNHIILSANAIRSKGLHCSGIILNQLSDELDTAMITNKGILEELTGLPLIDHLIHSQDFLDDEVLEKLGFPQPCPSPIQ